MPPIGVSWTRRRTGRPARVGSRRRTPTPGLQSRGGTSGSRPGFFAAAPRLPGASMSTRPQLVLRPRARRGPRLWPRRSAAGTVPWNGASRRRRAGTTRISSGGGLDVARDPPLRRRPPARAARTGRRGRPARRPLRRPRPGARRRGGFAVAAAGPVTLRVGWVNEPDNLNPFIGYSTSSYLVYHLNYDQLTGYTGEQRLSRPGPRRELDARAPTAWSGRSSCARASRGRTASRSPRPTSCSPTTTS